MLFPYAWPYAAKAAIQHEFEGDHLNIWITFTFPMNQLIKPADSKWIVKVSGIEYPITSSAWVDAYTLLLVVPVESATPLRVMVEYEGPGPTVWDPMDPLRETLEILWQKQWEPWGPILSQNIGS